VAASFLTCRSGERRNQTGNLCFSCTRDLVDYPVARHLDVRAQQPRRPLRGGQARGPSFKHIVVERLKASAAWLRRTRMEETDILEMADEIVD